MIPTPPLRAFVILLTLCLLAPRAKALELSVAPEGSDTQSGSRSKPFATLQRARDAIRAAQPLRESATVWIEPGRYSMAAPLRLVHEDSGTRPYPIHYRARHPHSVTLYGSLPLRLEWKPYRGGIVQATVPPEVESQLDFDRLFLNGVALPMARYPNEDPQAKYFHGTAADAISAERARRWSHPEDGYVHGLHQHEWGDFHYRILGLDAQGVPRLEGGWQNNRRMGLHERHRFVENLFEELDAPGEWFFDRRSHTLFLLPPHDVDPQRAFLSVSRGETLIELKGDSQHPVRFVSFEGLSFAETRRTFMKNREPLLRSDWTTYRSGAVVFHGTEDCSMLDGSLTAIGGNALYVDGYNRRVKVSGCGISDCGASGICFVGNPDAVRSPSFEYSESLPIENIDRATGPQSSNYPGECRVEDTLIQRCGQVEKQSAGVQIAMSQEITIHRCTLHDLPRAGINIGDGCWGGHVIEGCDIFDTVKETGDHGSFNSWGRDRYWLPDIEAVNQRRIKYPELTAELDAVKPTFIRHNRWRCDHGWDIDLDDGSSNYVIENNLCLNGGIKLREGFHRVVRNNIMVNNSFHPHVWFRESGDVFKNNIVMRPYAPIGMPKAWGSEIDHNLLPDALSLIRNQERGLDTHSRAERARFVAPKRGDFALRHSQALREIGFRNFPMDEFGVIRRHLRAKAGSPVFPDPKFNEEEVAEDDEPAMSWMGARAKGIRGPGEVSAAGLPGQIGVALLDVPEGSMAFRLGFRTRDVVLSVGEKPINDAKQLQRITQAIPSGKEAKVRVFRNQRSDSILFHGIN